MTNPYRQFVREVVALVQEKGPTLPLAQVTPPPPGKTAPNAPLALIFSPHPDDECVIGGLALRLRREAGWRITNVAVTQGSKKERQAARYAELEVACRFLDFGLVQVCPGGLEHINPKGRTAQPDNWAQAVARIALILQRERPQVVFFPHDEDANTTHIGTHHLVVEAMRALGPSFSCYTVETEFWRPTSDANLMVEVSEEHVADLMAALSCHIGEVARNPYHLSLVAWMLDNVRRGSELVMGQGAAAQQMTFATLYRGRRWVAGEWQRCYPTGRTCTQADSPAVLFA